MARGAWVSEDASCLFEAATSVIPFDGGKVSDRDENLFQTHQPNLWELGAWCNIKISTEYIVVSWDDVTASDSK